MAVDVNITFGQITNLTGTTVYRKKKIMKQSFLLDAERNFSKIKHYFERISIDWSHQRKVYFEGLFQLVQFIYSGYRRKAF